MALKNITKNIITYVVYFLIFYLIAEILYFIYVNGWAGIKFLFEQFGVFIGAIILLSLMTKFFRSQTVSKITAKIPWWMGGPIIRWLFKPRSLYLLRKRYKGVRNAYLKNIVFGGLTKGIMTKIPGLRNSFYKLRNVPGREPEIVYRNRLLFMRLLDQELRFDIWYTKYLYMRQYSEKFTKFTEATKDYVDQAKLKKNILSLMSHEGKVDIGERGSPHYIGEDSIHADTDIEYNIPGWNYTNKILIEYLNDLIRFFKEHIDKTNPRTRDKEKFNATEYSNSLKDIAASKEGRDVANISAALKVSHGFYEKRIQNYKNHYTIKAYALHSYDMMEAAGAASHRYKFAKKGARYVDRNGQEAQVLNDDTEVNIYGEFIEDVQRKLWPRRMLINPRRDSLPFPPGEDMGKIGNYFVLDWTVFITDFRFGLYHPQSRNIFEYIEAWDKGYWKDNKIPWAPRGGSQAAPAFDLRVLANPATWSWQGRKKFNSQIADTFEMNKEPHISQFGIKEFLLALIDRTSAQVEQDKLFLAHYPADTGQTPSTKAEQDTGKYTVGKFEETG